MSPTPNPALLRELRQQLLRPLLQLSAALPQPLLHLPPGAALLVLGGGHVVAGKAPQPAEQGAIVGTAAGAP